MRAAWADWLEAFYAGLVPLGLSVSRQAFGQCCDGFFGKDEPPKCDGLTLFERRIRSVAHGFGVPMPLGQVSALADGMADAWQRHVQLDPQTPDTLSRLRQTKTLALISNYDHPPYVHRLLREHKLDGFFHTIIISGAVGCKKPDPAIFRLALQQTGLAPPQVIYVGDTQDDVQGARAAGITPVLIVRRQNPTDPALLDFRHRQDCVSEPPLNPTSALTITSLEDVLTLGCL